MFVNYAGMAPDITRRARVAQRVKIQDADPVARCEALAEPPVPPPPPRDGAPVAQRPTQAQCERALANVRRLVDDPSAMSDDQTVAWCVRQSTIAETECVAEAATVAALEACGKPGQNGSRQVPGP